MSASTQETSATMQEMSSSAQVANNLVQDVSTAITDQTTTVAVIDKETERLETMSKELRTVIGRFKVE